MTHCALPRDRCREEGTASVQRPPLLSNHTTAGIISPAIPLSSPGITGYMFFKSSAVRLWEALICILSTSTVRYRSKQKSFQIQQPCDVATPVPVCSHIDGAVATCFPLDWGLVLLCKEHLWFPIIFCHVLILLCLEIFFFFFSVVVNWLLTNQLKWVLFSVCLHWKVTAVVMVVATTPGNITHVMIRCSRIRLFLLLFEGGVFGWLNNGQMGDFHHSFPSCRWWRSNCICAKQVGCVLSAALTCLKPHPSFLVSQFGKKSIPERENMPQYLYQDYFTVVFSLYWYHWAVQLVYPLHWTTALQL